MRCLRMKDFLLNANPKNPNNVPSGGPTSPLDGLEALIQVCADLDDPATLERETRALVEASREHRRATLYLISLAPEIPSDLPSKITAHAASAWLLASDPS